MKTSLHRLLLTVATFALATADLAAAPLRPLKIRVDDVPREALIHVPDTKGTALPVVFVFHGHGDTAQAAAKEFDVHEHWPEAICVYMQGLPTPSKLDPKGKHPGWQKVVGEYGDRDLKFFDAVLARLRKNHKIDDRRVYATGFSNGGYFTFVLWAARADVLAATAPCGCFAGANRKALKPKPCIHFAGQNDETVKLDVQQASMEFVRKLNGCDATGQPWNKGVKVTATLYPSSSGTPFVSVICPVGHEVPRAAGRMMVRFFKEQSRP